MHPIRLPGTAPRDHGYRSRCGTTERRMSIIGSSVPQRPSASSRSERCKAPTSGRRAPERGRSALEHRTAARQIASGSSLAAPVLRRRPRRGPATQPPPTQSDSMYRAIAGLLGHPLPDVRGEVDFGQRLATSEPEPRKKPQPRPLPLGDQRSIRIHTWWPRGRDSLW